MKVFEGNITRFMTNFLVSKNHSFQVVSMVQSISFLSWKVHMFLQ